MTDKYVFISEPLPLCSLICRKLILKGSVAETFHFAPAPASQVGSSSSSSSSSSVVLNFNLPGLVLFTERYECFALLFHFFT